ncbi:hypothetical protein V866_004702 [Kwoniella sp. B9012]|uniref:L-ornithine N(5)-monooxygenase n=1 Tax=Kwoniella europaea PYCC6329 TaxID=1423913 RepID=A0AAX4KJC4_9TREE
MPYRSHPYPEGTVEYPTYKTIYQYQQRFADKYTDCIRFNRVVTRVRHAPDGHPAVKRWVVEWTPSYTSNSPDIGKTFEEQFDHVVVANGTDSRPFIPYIDGLWNWKGEILHSRWYRTPEVFAGKTVMIVGGGPSSADLVREIGMLKVNKSPAQPKKIYRSFRSRLRYDTELEAGWTDHINNVSPMKILEGPSEHSKTGRITDVLDQVIDDVDQNPLWSLSARLRSKEVIVSDQEVDIANQSGVHNLDSHQLFYLPDPTLAFLLLHAEAIPWPFSEMQARVVASYWTGTPLELIPHPDEDNDSHSVLVLGHPGEFEYAEGLLKLIGEGGPEEVDSQGRWGAWPEWKKHIRALID